MTVFVMNALAMTALARTSRCDPSLIEAARGGDADALVSDRKSVV